MMASKPTPEQLETFLKGLSKEDLLELIVTRAHHDNRSPIEFISKSNGSSCGIDNEGYRLAVQEKADRDNEFFKNLEGCIRTALPTLAGQARKNFDGLGLNRQALELFDPASKVKDNTGPIIELNRLAAGSVERPSSPRIGQREDDEVNPVTLLRGHDLSIALGVHFHTTRPSAWFEEQKNGRKVSSTERFEKFVKEIPMHELLQLGDLIIDNPAVRGLGGYHSLALDQSEMVFPTDLPLIYGEIKSRFKQMGVVK